MSYTYEYPRPMVTTDIIVLRENNNFQEVLLIKRGNEPFINSWALPGGFVDLNEAPEACALRELNEETGLVVPMLNQFKTYGQPGRDPRGHTISIIFYGYNTNGGIPKAGDDAKDCKWFSINKLPEMAFDHKQIITDFLIEKNI